MENYGTILNGIFSFALVMALPEMKMKQGKPLCGLPCFIFQNFIIISNTSLPARAWCSSNNDFLRMTGLEPAHPCGHKDLNLARLPIPPHPHNIGIIVSKNCLVNISAGLRCLFSPYFFSVFMSRYLLKFKYYDFCFFRLLMIQYIKY